MNAIDLGQAIQILANFGVITGIVFLALELRQNNALMKAESLATMVSMKTDIWATPLENGEIVPMIIKDRQGEELTVAEEIRLNALWVRSLYNAEYIFEQAPERLPMEPWRRAFAAYGSLQRTWSGGGRGSALAAKDMFTPKFVEFFDSSISKRG